MFRINGMMMNDAAELQRRVQQFKADADTPVQGAVVDFGDRLKAATKRLAANRGQARTSRPAPESFGQKVADATGRILAARYHKRQPARSE